MLVKHIALRLMINSHSNKCHNTGIKVELQILRYILEMERPPPRFLKDFLYNFKTFIDLCIFLKMLKGLKVLCCAGTLTEGGIKLKNKICKSVNALTTRNKGQQGCLDQFSVDLRNELTNLSSPLNFLFYIFRWKKLHGLTCWSCCQPCQLGQPYLRVLP